MPLLSAETCQHPSDLLSAAINGDGQSPERGQWWAAQTRSRQEKQLMRKLLALDVAFYCPVAPHRYRSPSGRARVSHVPLFANYVFIAGDERARYQALTTGCVAHCLPAPDPHRLVRQLHAIAAAIGAGLPLQAESRIPVGAPVRVKAGPFTGVEGIVQQRRGEMRMYLCVDFIQRGASLAVNDWEVERL